MVEPCKTRRHPRPRTYDWLLFAIENALRELIIENLSKIGGPQWYKSRLPGDVLEKYREGIAAQRKAKWASLTFHHPIYYTDFPDLKKIIESKSNWEGAFKEIFTRKEILISTLSEIEEIQNSVAHNRKITAHDFKLVEAAATNSQQ